MLGCSGARDNLQEEFGVLQDNMVEVLQSREGRGKVVEHRAVGVEGGKGVGEDKAASTGRVAGIHQGRVVGIHQGRVGHRVD